MEGRQERRIDSPLLSIREVGVTFGGVCAVDHPSFEIPRAAIVSLIGPNGAGKTTLLNAISGFVKASGSIRFRDRELLRLPAYRRAGLGIGRTFQNLQLFESMTLLDNVTTGQHARLRSNLLFDILRLPALAEEREARQRSREILRQLGIEEYAERRAGALPFGVQKLAGVARALAAQPELLLLDEPAAGLNPQEVDALGRLIVDLRDRGLTILLVEHNMRLVMSISDRVVVLDDGRKLTEGEAMEVGHNPAVVEAYLGTAAAPALPEEVRHELLDRP